MRNLYYVLSIIIASKGGTYNPSNQVISIELEEVQHEMPKEDLGQFVLRVVKWAALEDDQESNVCHKNG